MVSGIEQVGSSTADTKTVTVIYPHCYKVAPVAVTLQANGSANYSEQFAADLLTNEIWGFRASVVRTDAFVGWNQTNVVLRWTAIFGELTLSSFLRIILKCAILMVSWDYYLSYTPLIHERNVLTEINRDKFVIVFVPMYWNHKWIRLNRPKLLCALSAVKQFPNNFVTA